MDENERAKEFVLHGIRSTDFQKVSSMVFLPINALVIVVSIILWQEIIYRLLGCLLMLLNIVFAIVCYAKWNAIVGFVSQVGEMLFFSIAHDLICYGMYNRADCFVWYEFLIFVSVQIVVFVICIPLNIFYYKSFKSNTRPIKNAIAGSVAACACEAAVVCCKIFLTNATLNLVILIISLLLNIVIYLLAFCIVLAFYRVHFAVKCKLVLE